MNRSRSLFRLLPWFALACFCSRASAQITEVSLLTASPQQYEKTQWQLQVTAAWDNPYYYDDIAVDMEITAPCGRRITLPCYFVSGRSGESSKWGARFTPQEPGSYACRFTVQMHNQPAFSSEATHFSVSATEERGFLHVNDPWTLRFDNGERFRGIGQNIGWEARNNDDSKFFKVLHENPRFHYEYLLGVLAAHGGNFMRTWMCAWNLPLEWKRVIDTGRYEETTEHFNPGAIARLDQLVELADSLGVYIMLTIEYHGAFGGRGWNLSSYNAVNGGPVASPEAFFSDAGAKRQFKSRLRYLVARWGYATSIAAWELFNEIDNVIYAGHLPEPIPAAVITGWHDEMSTFIKSIDPYGHIVTTSISHRDVEGLNALPHLDINQKHIYGHTLAIAGALRDNATRFQKPYVIGEFAHDWDWSKNFDLAAEEFDADFRRGLWLGLFSPTPVLPMTWWWEYFDERRMTAYYARVREIYTDMMNAGNGSFAELTVVPSDDKAQAWAVRCGEKIFVYLLNPENRSLQTDVRVDGLTSGAHRVQRYDTTTGHYHAAAEITAAKASAVLSTPALPAGGDVILVMTPSWSSAAVH